ncbi:MAG: adenosylcobinamide-GDP ribazoletransferase [Candidatus Nanopelagicales bacterium]
MVDSPVERSQTAPAGFDAFRFAIGTFTRIPVAAPARLDRRIARGGLALGPIVGATIGLITGLLLLVTPADSVGRLLGATIVVGAAAWLTRALHWDGLADFADGLGSGAPADRALDIMRRSDIGPFGVLALGFTAAVQVTALACVPSGAPALSAWVVALAAGRLAIAIACGPWARAARSDGLGVLVVGAVTPGHVVAALGLALAAAAVPTTLGHLTWRLTLVCVPVSTALVTGWISRAARRRLGGSTGDVLGATAEASTAAALVVIALG